MDALTLLRDQAKAAEETVAAVFATVTPEQAVWKPEGSLANTIAGTFLHVYHGEDSLIQARLHDRPTLFQSGGWPSRLPYDPAVDAWRVGGPVDVAACREYAADVAASSARFLAELDPAALERPFDTPRGVVTLAFRLGLILVTHKFLHLGEIGALLGMQGAKGFPR